jgi:hypothetical protein
LKIIEYPLTGGKKINFPELIVVHSMGEHVIGSDKLIRHAPAHLAYEGFSATVLVCPNGDRIRCRRDDQGAAHAKGFNDNSLGIEFLVPGKHDYISFLKMIKEPWVSEDQYQSGLEQIREWYETWKGIKRIARHSDIDPSRKRDPGDGFPWERLRKDLGL